MTNTSLLVDVGWMLESAGGIAQYVLVFVLAAIPLVEALVVVPVAIGLGLDPVATGLAAFTGNVASLYAFVCLHERLADWWRNQQTSHTTGERSARARRLWKRYGVAGLSLSGPAVTGAHIAAFVALVAGSSGRTVAGWLTVSVAVWTGLAVAGSVVGASLLGVA